jgi:CubicO group peptidase (beta-lactamase class C family)
MRSETDAFLVLHDGHIIAERYFGKATPRTRHHLWSASRSYLAIVAAQYLNGPLNKTTRVTEYIDELRGTGFEGATIQNLLDQNTSLDCREFLRLQGCQLNGVAVDLGASK